MGEQQVFQKQRCAALGALAFGVGRRRGADFHLQRDAGHGYERGPGVGGKGQGDEGRPQGHDLVTQLSGQLLPEVGRADLGDGQTASGDHDLVCMDEPAIGVDFKAHGVGVGGAQGADSLHGAGLPAGDVTGVAFAQQHLDDVVGAVVAKQLAAVFLVPGNAMAFDQAQKVLRGEAGQGGAAEMRVLAEKVGGRDLTVGEVAAPAPGDADFFGDFGGVVQQQHLQATLACDSCTHQTGCACADHHHIVRRHAAIVAAESRLPRWHQKLL